MKLPISRTLFSSAIALIILAAMACSGVAASNSGNSPVIISAVTVEHATLYPLGNTNITCSAISKEGLPLHYKWVCDEGTIIGEGPTVKWEAPRTYGDFNIMVIVDDGKGHSSTGTARVTVIVRDPSKCCK